MCKLILFIEYMIENEFLDNRTQVGLYIFLFLLSKITKILYTLNIYCTFLFIKLDLNFFFFKK